MFMIILRAHMMRDTGYHEAYMLYVCLGYFYIYEMNTNMNKK